MVSTVDIDESSSLPRAFIAHQQAVDLMLVALISTHPDPQCAMRQFRTLINQLTAATSQPIPEASFLAAIRRSATRFDVMVERLLPAISPAPRIAPLPTATRGEEQDTDSLSP